MSGLLRAKMSDLYPADSIEAQFLAGTGRFDPRTPPQPRDEPRRETWECECLLCGQARYGTLMGAMHAGLAHQHDAHGAGT